MYKLKLILMISIIFSLTACGSNKVENTSSLTEDEPITLSYAFFASERSFPAIIAKMWGESLEERTNGKVKVDFYFGGALLDAGNMLDGVTSGVTDIGLAGLTNEPGRFPLVEISDMQAGLPNTKVASQVVSDIITEFSPNELSNYKIVKVFTTEPIYLQSRNPIASLEDIQGQQLRIGGSLTPLIKTLGGSPIAMSQAEVAQALQTGIISGYVSERAMLKDQGFAELVDYYTDFSMGVFTFAALMDKNVWEGLPDDVKQVIEQLSQEMPLIAGEYFDKQVAEAIEWSKEEHGLQVVSLTEEESRIWEERINVLQQEAVQNANEQGHPGTEYFNRLTELIEKYSNE